MTRISPPTCSPLTALAIVALFSGQNAAATERQAHHDIHAVVKQYQHALNNSDVNAVTTLYADSGVFMPQHKSAHVGKDAIRTAYQDVFNAIDLNITFDIHEVIQTGEQWAIVRTTSTGTTTIHATGNNVPENNQELFLLQKQADGRPWRIARYIFTTTSPRRN